MQAIKVSTFINNIQLPIFINYIQLLRFLGLKFCEKNMGKGYIRYGHDMASIRPIKGHDTDTIRPLF